MNQMPGAAIGGGEMVPSVHDSTSKQDAVLVFYDAPVTQHRKVAVDVYIGNAGVQEDVGVTVPDRGYPGHDQRRFLKQGRRLLTQPLRQRRGVFLGLGYLAVGVEIFDFRFCGRAA